MRIDCFVAEVALATVLLLGGRTFGSVVVDQCMVVNGQHMIVGTLEWDTIPDVNSDGLSDIRAIYRQSRDVVDNTYGVNVSSGYPSGHTFSNLTGSDTAEFVFTDTNGDTVLHFFFDYLTAAATPLYPSGFGTLGVFGGDGSMVVGSAANVLGIGTLSTTSMTTNLNNPLFQSGYTSDSPVEPNADWDYVNGYRLVVSGAAFGAAGFGSVSVPSVHNSPSKLGFNEVRPTPCAHEFIPEPSALTVWSLLSMVGIGCGWWRRRGN